MYTESSVRGSNLRGRFTHEALTTASAPRIVVMCFERADRDLAMAIEALERGDAPSAHDLLCHAQDIVHELLCMLDLDAWEHAPRLAAIYRFVLELLTRANIGKRVGPAGEAKRLLAELGGAFREAFSTTPSAAPAPRRPDRFSITV
jgi:flagellar protein FliS